jgi:hypothetical protein
VACVVNAEMGVSLNAKGQRRPDITIQSDKSPEGVKWAFSPPQHCGYSLSVQGSNRTLCNIRLFSLREPF